MHAFLRMLLVAISLLASGVAQVVLAQGDDACCAEEDAPAPACPPGAACACCPAPAAAPAIRTDVAPSSAMSTAVPAEPLDPSVATAVADIFHPPRA